MNDVFDLIIDILKFAKTDKMQIAEKEVYINVLFDSLKEKINFQNELSPYETSVKLNEFKHNVKSILGI